MAPTITEALNWLKNLDTKGIIALIVIILLVLAILFFAYKIARKIFSKKKKPETDLQIVQERIETANQKLVEVHKVLKEMYEFIQELNNYRR